MKTLWSALSALLFASVALAQPPTPSPRSLFEAGQYDQTLQAVAATREKGSNDPADTFLAAQSHLKANRRDEAKGEFGRLAGMDDQAWKLVGESGTALVDNNADRALETANQAVAASGDAFFPHYQLGLVKAERQDWNGAAEAFERASQIDPAFAYAHYYAGLSYSRINRVDRTATHFERFLKLAPKAPERAAVESIMRTLRGR